MKKRFFKQLTAACLVLCMTTPNMQRNVYAGDTLPYLGESAKGVNQPYQHGYRAEDLLSWNPATDPYADLLRARVPLQKRIAPVAATQAKPSLSTDIQYFTLAGDYGNSFFDSYSYTNEFSQHVFNFWQYIDYYGSWHGMPSEGVPESLYNAAGERDGSSNWEKRTFEFGMMNLPNAAYTNAAHKNGVLSIGCLFQPRAYQSWRTLLKKDADGNYPYAKKLIEVCQYYGFDGWFFNLEGSDHVSSSDEPEMQAFMKVLRDAGLYVQWYNASSSAAHSYLSTKAADSVFLDYGWSTSSIASDVAKANTNGLNGKQAIFGGIEAGRDRWSNGRYFSKDMNASGEIISSIASLGTDFVQSGLDEDLGTSFLREQDEYQWMAFQREKMWWTGSSGDPTNTTITSDESVGVNSNTFQGVSQFIAERSVIDGDTFVTNFNTGHGLIYAVNGKISNSHEWSNISIQDILPTWQWWFQTSGTAKLKADFDYGTTYKKYQKDKTTSSFDFTQIDPYKGGSSLAVYGLVDSGADNFLHLYKTNLNVNTNSKMSITFKKTSSDDVAMNLGVVFDSDINTSTNTYKVTTLPITNSAKASDGWVTATVDLSQYKGKHIAVLGLKFNGKAKNYQMHIGELKYTSGNNLTPAVPTGLSISKAYSTGEMVVNWDIASYDSVKQYNVYAVIDGNEMYMGGIYDSIYYIKNTYGATGKVTIKVTAVGEDGTESAPASVVYDYSKAVKNVKVNATDGNLFVSWDAISGYTGDVEVTVKNKESGTVYTATAKSGTNTVNVKVPTGADADGADYTMSIIPAGQSVVNYDGKLNDSYCIPYDGKMMNRKFNGPVQCRDWYKLSYTYTLSDGTTKSDLYIRGTKSHGELNNDWSVFSQLPSNISQLTVTLTDYTGNESKPVSYVFKDGEPLDLTTKISSAYFPDEALLTILKEKVGLTLGDIMNYSGALDLSNSEVKDLTGLTLMDGLTALDLSGSAVTSVSDSVLPKGLSNLNIKNCTSLTTVDLQNSKLQLDFTGCIAMTNLKLTGTTMTSIDITDMTKLRVVYLNNSQISEMKYAKPDVYTNIYNLHIENSKLDLSDNTAEGILIKTIQAQTITPIIDTVESNVASKSNCSNTKLNDGNTTSSLQVRAGDTYVFDFGSKQMLTQFNMTMSSSSYYPTGVTIYVSDDDTNYTEVGTWTGLTNANSNQKYVFNSPVNGRYYKLKINSIYNRYSSYSDYYNYGNLYEVGLYGYATEPYGVYITGQKPEIIKDAVSDVTYKCDGTQYQMLDILNANYASARTIKGTRAVDLTGASWIDMNYLKNQTTVPATTKAVITTDKGDIYVPSKYEDPKSKLGNLITTDSIASNATIMGSSGQTGTNESVEMMFDNDPSTKWCFNGGETGWAAIALSESKVIGRWDTLNAGNAESTEFNTKDYCLQVLDEQVVGMSEDQYIDYLNNLTEGERKTALANNSIWKTISSITDNNQTEVTKDITDLYSARLYRIYVTKPVQGTSDWAIRLYDVKLYAYEGTLGSSVNGVFVADTPGEYHVSFLNNSEQLATMKVTVIPKNVAVSGAALNVDKLNLSVSGSAISLVPMVYPDNATNKEVIWDSSDTKVATVSDIGLVTPVSSGKAIITMTTVDGGFTATCEVTVSEYVPPVISVSGVTLNVETLTLKIGDTPVVLQPLVTPDNATYKDVIWSSSDSNVAVVSPSGLVTTVSPGTAIITVSTVDGGKTATCKVIILDKPTPEPTTTPEPTPTPVPATPTPVPVTPTLVPSPTSTPTSIHVNAGIVDEDGDLVIKVILPKGDSTFKTYQYRLDATDELLNQINNSNVKNVYIEVCKSQDDKQTNIIIAAEILKAVKDNKKNITVTVKGTNNKEEYSWTWEKNMLESSKEAMFDVNLSLEVEAVKDNKELSEKLGEDASTNALFINFAHEGILPAQTSVRIYVGDKVGIKPGMKIFLYHYNKESGKLETLPYSSNYVVDQDGFMTINIIHCSDYVALMKKAPTSIITSLKQQITVTLDKDNLYLKKGKNQAKIKVELPLTLAQVDSLDDKLNTKAVGGVTVTYESSDKKIASIDSKGNITAFKTGKVIITTKITLYSGKVKVVKFTITVNK